MSDTPTESQIEESDNPEPNTDVEGVEEGQVLETTNKNLDGETVQEVVVYDTDDEGNTLDTWHKEVVG